MSEKITLISNFVLSSHLAFEPGFNMGGSGGVLGLETPPLRIYFGLTVLGQTKGEV